MKQKSLKSPFTVKGKGLHTGLDLVLSANPAPANTGIWIKRIDLEGAPSFEALADYVNQTTRGTVLKVGEAQVSTIEHAMAAFYAAGIDNCVFEVNGPEFPILDGSAKEYVAKILKVGTEEQDADKDFLMIKEEIVVEYPNGSRLEIIPADKFSIEVEIGFNSDVLPDQFAQLNDLNEFGKGVSDCRTFVFVREIEPLLNMNLIKGGDLKNAIVIYDKEMSQEQMDVLTDKLNQPKINANELGYLSGPLKYENEPARHKLLDVIGDLALVGKPMIAKVKARYPGHQINTETAKTIRQSCL